MTSTRRVRIAAKAVEAEDICSFQLVAADDQPLPAFSPGSHIDVHLPGGPVRPYSLCNHVGTDTADAGHYRIAVLKEPASRGGSAGMHALEVGAGLEISAPRNHFALAADAQRSLLFAGGIGITPLLCMAERLAATGADFVLHYATRTAARTAFAEQLRRAPYAERVHLHHDDGPAGQRLDLAATIGAPDAGTHLYVCGPAGFMGAVLSAARALGWPEQRLHREYFGAAPAAPGAALPTAGAFLVQVASTGALIPVAPDQSVVAALAAAGISVPVSCEQGVCGTCLTRVIDGIPDHRDLFLTDEERQRNDCFTPCCSRAATPRLVLAL